MSQNFQHIIAQLPYGKPFLFVDELTSLTEDGATGTYTFQSDSYFYEGHFKNRPITPGVILTECMAQIGVVCLGLFLLKDLETAQAQIALSNQTIDFYEPVFPGETVRVISEKEYFRFHKLKCNVKMLNAAGTVVAKGTISGMINGTSKQT
ncbi:MAG: hydroxymyristoyl-ACP dehydratase [Marinirhabdus sp.]|nr:hydroxymyristoyl-ACP dehydratase [Marinirhabdus sp.]